ncbi:MAG TPA: hypothetical protein VLA84_20520 [Microcoleus sp.]|nr:hypothetical protein [Microcoleus sp.]
MPRTLIHCAYNAVSNVPFLAEGQEHHHFLLTQHQMLPIEIPPGIPHAVINFSSDHCLVLNAIIRHGSPHPKNYQPIKKPFPFDLERVNELLQNEIM